MGTVTGFPEQETGPTVRLPGGRRPAHRNAPSAKNPAPGRGPTHPQNLAGRHALHAEIDNPLDLVAGHHLLAEAEHRAARTRTAAACDCGHPMCLAAVPPAGGVRVFLITRHAVTGAGLRSVLTAAPETSVVGSSADPDGAPAAVRRVRPDVILLGCGPTLADDLATVVALRAPHVAPHAGVLLLRRAETTAEAGRILLAGAAGCFPVDLAEDRIVNAVTLAAAGGTVFLPAPPPARNYRAGLPAETAPQQAGLTARELDVLAQLALGLSNAEIGRELALAEATVKKHLTQAMRKIGQSDRLRAALYAHRHGLAG
ncbi:response regulator transcription factor [Streptomyces sp. NPDC060194]|uniref:response regulator transcription factor n=1 Tax=Streptomyces sp. NPDC060194 TaxID=3347069 RepID=UPI00365D5F59